MEGRKRRVIERFVSLFQGVWGGWTRRVDVKGWSQEVERVCFFFVSLWPVHTGVCVVVRCVVCVRTVRAGQWQQQEV